MNKSSWIGFAIAAAVLYFGVFKSHPNPTLFLDSHAILLVIGGTVAAAFISIRYKKMEDLMALLLYGLLLKKKSTNLTHARELLGFSIYAYNQKTLDFIYKFTHPYANEGFQLAQKKYLSDDELKIVLGKRNEYFRQSYQGDAKALNALGKFPPAFGLLGATTGMIAMMTQLGTEGGQEQIGPAMAIALIATFWGIAVANLIILPMADYANKAAQEDQVTRQMIAESIFLTRQKVDPAILAERLATYLPPHQRNDLRSGFELKPDSRPQVSEETVIAQSPASNKRRVS